MEFEKEVEFVDMDERSSDMCEGSSDMCEGSGDMQLSSIGADTAQSDSWGCCGVGVCGGL